MLTLAIAALPLILLPTQQVFNARLRIIFVIHTFYCFVFRTSNRRECLFYRPILFIFLFIFLLRSSDPFSRISPKLSLA